MRRIVSFEFSRRPGARIRAADAEVIGRRLIEISPDGGATPQQIVDDARGSGSPLHRFFEWNDSLAAERHREQQARMLLHSVEITINYSGGQREQVKAFHSVVLDGDRQYTVAPTVFGSQALSDQVVAQARRELEGWERRYGNYSALATAAKLIRSAMATLISDRDAA